MTLSERLTSVSSSLRRGVEDAAIASTTWAPIAFCIALGPGLLAWALTGDRALDVHFRDNRLATLAQTYLFVRLLGSVLCVGAVYAAVAWRGLVRAGRFDHAAMRRTNRALAFLLAIPCGLVFLVEDYERAHPFLMLLFGVIAALSVAVSAAELTSRLPRWRFGRTGTVVAVLVVVLLAAGWATWIVRLQIVQYQALRAGVYDLGIYVNVMWQSLQGNFLGCSFLLGETHASAHFDPILIALSPILLVHRGAESLFVLQASWLASGAIPVFLLGRRHGGRAFGVAFAFAYLLHPALQGVSLFDFHSMSLSLPFVLWAVWSLEEKRWVAYAITIALWLSCREDMALWASCLGVYAIAVHRQVRVGVLTIVLSAIYLVLIKRYAMPDPDLLMTSSSESYGYRYYFRAIDPRGVGVLGMLATLVSNPSFVVQHVFQEARVLFLLQLLVPLAFLPLAGGRRWVLLAYGMLLILLASRHAVFLIGFHYATTALGAMFATSPSIAASVASTLERRRGVPRRQTLAFLGAFMVVGSVLMTDAFGAFAPNDRFVAGLYTLRRELTEEDRERYAWLMHTTRDMPADARVVASGTVLAHFATRDRIYSMPHVGDAEWVVTETVTRGRPHVGVPALRRDRRWERVGEAHGLIVFRRRH